MSIISVEPKEEEKTTPIKEVSQEDVFRFPYHTFDQCVQEKLFWRKINDPSRNKEKRVYVASLNGSEVRSFDEDRPVVSHKCDSLIHINR